MLRIFDTEPTRDCERVCRREFLRIGSLGLGGLSLPGLLAAQANAAQGQNPVRDKAVVVLFLGGGPPQHETFDPKMGAPAEYRAMFGEVQTNLPGVTFGHHMQRLAGLADQLAVVRSYRHGNSSHGSATAQVIAGGNDTEAMLGSVYARVAGTTNPRNGLPNNMILGPAAAGADFRGAPDYTQRCGAPGSLGSTYKPFDPSGGGPLRQNMELRIPRKRLDDRRTLLGLLDQLKRQRDANDSLAGVDRFNEQAFDILLGGATDAFDLSKEPPEVLARYDTSHIKIPKSVIRRKRKGGFERQSPEYLGKQMLLARRLVEAGCGFVTVTSTGWDLHGNRFGVDDGMPILGTAADHAAGAFLEDIRERGLSEKVLLVITGEFGRTPKINKKGGRDHWGNLCPLVFAGGGWEMGQVIGDSDRYGAKPATDPIGLDQVAATVLHTVFDPGILRLHPDVPKEIKQAVAQANPIQELGQI